MNQLELNVPKLGSVILTEEGYIDIDIAEKVFTYHEFELLVSTLLEFSNIIMANKNFFYFREKK